MEVVALILDRHPVGILVIEGRTELDGKDIAAMYALARNIPMRGKAPLDVQSFASAAELVGYMELNRCRETLPKAAAFYKEREPRKYAVLREIGLPGMPGARSLEGIAAAHGIYTKNALRMETRGNQRHSRDCIILAGNARSIRLRT